MLSEKLRQFLLRNLSEVEVRAASHLERLTREPHPSNRALRRQMRQERKHARMLRSLAGLPVFKVTGSDGQFITPQQALPGLSSHRLVRLTYGHSPSTQPRLVQLAKIQAFELASWLNYSLVTLLPIWTAKDRSVLASIRSDEWQHIALLKPFVNSWNALKACAEILKGLILFVITPIDE